MRPRIRSGKRKASLLRRILLGLLSLLAAFYLSCAFALVALKWIDPFTTGVQMQRRVQAVLGRRPYHKLYVFLPLRRISPELQHAVLASEDERFYQHHGIDWKEVNEVVDRDLDRGQLGRGASTVTQQLVKNLFFTTSRSALRKAIEMTLAPPADFILGKQRVLELYMNVIEWGPGVYGAEAAANFYYKVPAAHLGRDQAARLAAIIPAPLKRKPARMEESSARILDRMRAMGW